MSKLRKTLLIVFLFMTIIATSVATTVVIAPNLAQAETSTDDIMTALYNLRRRV